MTVRLLVNCDGGPDDRPIPLAECRAFVPVRVATTTVDAARREAVDGGWSTDGARDLCPSCTRSRTNRCAHTSTMLRGGVRVCADCGAALR